MVSQRQQFRHGHNFDSGRHNVNSFMEYSSASIVEESQLQELHYFQHISDKDRQFIRITEAFGSRRNAVFSHLRLCYSSAYEGHHKFMHNMHASCSNSLPEHCCNLHHRLTVCVICRCVQQV